MPSHEMKKAAPKTKPAAKAEKPAKANPKMIAEGPTTVREKFAEGKKSTGVPRVKSGKSSRW